MKSAIATLMVLLVSATTAFSQDSSPRSGSSDPHKGVKLIIGIGALAVGTAVAAKSSQTTTVTSAVGTAETSSFSSSQLIAGLAIAGAGGILLWDGLREHQPPQPATVWGVGVSKGRGGQFFWRHRW
jgi:hypothetical protein